MQYIYIVLDLDRVAVDLCLFPVAGLSLHQNFVQEL